MGFPNSYFLGFSFLFFFMMIFHFLYGGYDLYLNSAQNPIDLKSDFSWYNREDTWVSDIVFNQMKPLYLILYFIVSLTMAAQIYPLEQANGWKKNPIMKLIIVCSLSFWLLFIPPIGNSVGAVFLILLGFFGIGIGAILNIAINIKLYLKTTGELRRRALYAALAFLLFVLGMLWSIELEFGQFFHESIGNRDDVIIGCCIQIFAAYFYNQGFKGISSEYKLKQEKEGKEIIPEQLSILDNFQGQFTKYNLNDWLFYGTLLIFIFIGLAWYVYPEGNSYSIMKDTISFLGSSDSDNNPKGWWLLTISLFIMGVFLIPLTIYRHKRLSKIDCKMPLIKINLSNLSLLFYIIASIGLILIGIFPDNQGEDFFGDLGTGGKKKNFLKILKKECGNLIPIWKDELYLEFHRGCYTSQANLKKLNRLCEVNIRNLEILATILYLFSPEFKYPKKEIDKFWKTILFN